MWGGNPYSYGTCSYKNLCYFWTKQGSLIFGDSKTEFNQHNKDKELIESMEMSEEENNQSKMSYSHVGENIDNKSMRSNQSYKSKKSIKSEFVAKI